jgi:hypothetical protein
VTAAASTSHCEICRALERAATAHVAVEDVRELAERTQIAELAWVVDALELRPGTVNRARVSAAAAVTVGERVAHRRQLRALTTDYRLAAVGLPTLPLVAAVLIGVTNPSSLASFVTRPVGPVLVGVAVALSVVAGRLLRGLAAVPPVGTSLYPGQPDRSRRLAVGVAGTSAVLAAVAVPLPLRFLPLGIAVVAGAAIGWAASGRWVRRSPTLVPEIDVLDRASVLASAGYSPRRALAVLAALDPAAVAGIDESLEVTTPRPGRAELVLQTRARDLRAREKSMARAGARQAPARIGALTAGCVVPAVLCLLGGPVAVT